MRILYGVVGEGMGHAMRSRVVLEHLLSQGHQVEIMASQRAVRYLQERFPEVHEIHGLHIIYEENRVRKGKTLVSNVRTGVRAVPSQIKAYFRLVEDFEPDAVISDFESWSYFYAKAHGLPIYSVDNMQILNRCTLPPEVLEGHRADYELSRMLVKSKLPFCDHYLIATFFHPAVRKKRTSLHPPILRPQILAARDLAARGEHLLVYQTAEGHEALVEGLRKSGIECRIYGMKRTIQADEVDGNLLFRPFSERTFVEDLATARAVIAGGGFTLMGECVFLHKPMLSLPIGGQFEQVLNARYLEHLGYGQMAVELDVPTLRAFLDAVPSCEERLSSYSQDGNKHLLGALDDKLARHA